MRHVGIPVLVVVVLLILTLTASAATTVQYQIQDLGFGNTWAQAYDINNKGQITGYAVAYSGGPTYAFVRNTDGTTTRLRPLSDKQLASCRGNSINDLGQVCGAAADDNYDSHPVMWDTDGTITDIGMLVPDSHFHGAEGINDLGQVVGYSGAYNGQPTYAFTWSDMQPITNIGALSGFFNRAMDINNSGEVVGYSNNAGTGNYHHGFRWSTDTGMVDLGVLAGMNYSTAHAINDSGIVVGDSWGAWGQHACLWNPDGTIVDLGTMLGWTGTFGLAINNRNQVAGGVFSGQTYVASYWSAETGWQLLGTLPGDDKSQALGINDSGQIVGWSYNTAANVYHAVVWQPVPEPSSVATLLIGLLGITRLAIRKRA